MPVCQISSLTLCDLLVRTSGRYRYLCGPSRGRGFGCGFHDQSLFLRDERDRLRLWNFLVVFHGVVWAVSLVGGVVVGEK
jgi:hypothetical protein